jgi:hypothetical protein
MPRRHLSYGSEFGVALHESGLNGLSAGLRNARPELFAFRTEIPIVAPSGSDPGHILTLYAVADEPIAFNLYPVANAAVPEDGFFIKVNILFTLTDSRLGAITRMRLQAEAAGEIARQADNLSIRLLKKPDGSPWFDITSLEGEHPAMLKLLEGRIDGTIDLGDPDLSGDGGTARSFRAIMNYLITLFLKEGLTRVVTEFPLPSLSKLVEAGPLGTLPGRDIYVRNDALYLTLGGANPGDGGFPAPFRAADLAVGVSEKGLQRVMDAMTPMPIPIEVGSDNSTFRLRSSNFGVRTIRTDLRPGDDKLFGQVYFGGDLNTRLQFKVFGAWVRTPWLPIPIDASLSQYMGLIRPSLEIVKAGEPGERLELRLRPDTRFLEAWAVIVETNYRGLFTSFFRSLVASVKDNLIYKKLKKIPIIGWIVDQIIDKTAEVLGWALGAPLDAFLTTLATLTLNTIGRAVIQFMARPEFTVLKIEQAAIKAMTGLMIASGYVEQTDDGRGGELALGLSFAGGHFPTPAPPVPIPPEPAPPPIPEPDPFPSDPVPDLPEHPASAFEPLFVFPDTQWPDQLRERYSVETTGARRFSGTLSIRGDRQADGSYQLSKALAALLLPGETTTLASYDDRGRPIRATYQQQGDGFTTEQTVDLATAGVAEVSSTLGPSASFERRIAVLDRNALEFDELWPFRFGHCALADGMTGAFGRVEIGDPFEFGNWARQVPVRLSVSDTSVTLPGETQPTDAFSISAIDEDGKTRITVIQDRGVVEIEMKTSDGEIVIRRLW